MSAQQSIEVARTAMLCLLRLSGLVGLLALARRFWRRGGSCRSLGSRDLAAFVLTALRSLTGMK